MPINILISGMPRSGKTTLVKKIYKEFKNKISFLGFYSEEILENNKRVGFKIVEVPNEKEYLLAYFNPLKSNFKKYYVFVENLDLVSKKLLESLNKDNIYIIDEIGPMELKSNYFRKLINNLFKININFIATIHRSLTDKYKGKYKIYWLDRENFDKIYKEIKEKLYFISTTTQFSNPY